MLTHKTVLVSCHIKDSPQAIPLAASILKSYQPYKQEVDVILEDFYLNNSPEKAAALILNHNPDSVGLSVYIWNRKFFTKTAEIIKSKNKNIIVFAGGADITALAETLVNNSNFDYLIKGEGELPFVQLLEYFIGKENHSPPKIIPEAYLHDLGKIPSPYLNQTIEPRKWKGLLWELSRGCPFNCSFCSESRGVRGVRYYSEERIKNELILFEEKKVEQIFVLDPTFNVDKKRALEILSLIRKYSPEIHFTFEIRAELLDRELAKTFSKLNCSLQIGLQSSSSSVLKNINRKLDPNKFSEKINLLNKFGVVFGLDLIYGLPGDTLEGFLKSLDYALLQIPNHLDIFRLSVFPGTELYEKKDHFNIICESNAPYSVIRTPSYTKEYLLQSDSIAEAVNIFYNEGRAAGWFLSIVDILNMTPSEFLLEFSKYVQTRNSVINSFEIQNSFLSIIFNQLSKEIYLPIALDLCKFHFLYAKILYTRPLPETGQTKEIDPYKTVFQKSPSLVFGVFNYNPLLYSENGMVNINKFTKKNRIEKSYVIIINNGVSIETIPVEKWLYDINIEINGKQTFSEILLRLKISFEDAGEFINFLLETESIIPVI
ncbi:MAG: radical SAM protein [Spirochaetales bacterium]|nr:radical SAM protein [Spirochaetales bacterium]